MAMEQDTFIETNTSLIPPTSTDGPDNSIPTMIVNTTTLLTPVDVPPSRPSTSRGTPATTPVFLQPPLPTQSMAEGVTFLPMPLQNNVFVVATYDRQKAIELCGPALADISKDDFLVSREC